MPKVIASTSDPNFWQNAADFSYNQLIEDIYNHLPSLENLNIAYYNSSNNTISGYLTDGANFTINGNNLQNQNATINKIYINNGNEYNVTLSGYLQASTFEGIINFFDMSYHELHASIHGNIVFNSNSFDFEMEKLSFEAYGFAIELEGNLSMSINTNELIGADVNISGKITEFNATYNGQYFSASEGSWDFIELDRLNDFNDIISYFQTGNSDFISGDDLLMGSSGDEVIDGGNGIDTLILSGLPSQYKISDTTLTGIEGTDSLISIERFRFGNSTFTILDASSLTDPDGAGPADTPATDCLQGISDLYVAYFNRAPDVEGLMYWFREVMNGSWTLSTIAQSFTDQPEYKTTYPEGLSNREFIKTIYQNIFDRDPDDAGWAYWEKDLNSGLPRNVFIYTVIQGAYAPSGGASDRALLNNKHDVSLYYSEQLAIHSSEGFDYNIDNVLDRVTSDASTIQHAKDVIDYSLENPITLTELIQTPPTWESFWA